MNSDFFMECAFAVMLVLIVWEAVASYVQGKNYYRLNVFLADVSNGVIFGMAGVFILLGALFVYDKIETGFSLSQLGFQFFRYDNPWAWVVSIVLTDFLYYWFHRHAHTFNILWACHVTHHSTEEMNLSVAFRGNFLQRIFEYSYFLPMALLGIPWEMFLFSHRILKVYQFAVHTRFVGKLGFLEQFMVTPSNHRVHHGTQKKYVDKNHGGIFIIWDRLFKSFEWETEEPIYGLTKPVRSFNPLTVNLHVYREIFQNVFKAKSIKDALGIIFKEPGWKPDYLRTPEDEIKEPAYTEKYDPKTPNGVMVYVTLQALVLAAVGIVIWKVAKLNLSDPTTLALVASIIVFSLFSINRTMEMKRWSRRTEFIRNLLFSFLFLGALFYSNTPQLQFFAIPLLGLSVLSLLWIWFKRKTFFDLTQISNTWI